MSITSPVLAQIDDELSLIAPRGYMFALHLRFSRPVRRTCTYPSDWIQTYTRRNLGIGDPMMIWCMVNEGAIRWSALSRCMADPMRVMGQAFEHGLTYGAALAHGPMESRSYIGAAHHRREFTGAEIDRMTDLLRLGHEHLEQVTALRPILVEALLLVESYRGARHQVTFLPELSQSVDRLLRERPSDIKGIAVAGMPAGSPGMENTNGTKQPFDVVAFGANGQTRLYRSVKG